MLDAYQIITNDEYFAFFAAQHQFMAFQLEFGPFHSCWLLGVLGDVEDIMDFIVLCDFL